jgi:hypothetical protein
MPGQGVGLSPFLPLPIGVDLLLAARGLEIRELEPWRLNTYPKMKIKVESSGNA